MGQRNVDINLYIKQTYFVASEALMSLFMSGVCSGKTPAGAVKALMLSRRFPNESGLIVANTYPQLGHSTLPLFFKILDEVNVRYNWSEGKEELYIFAEKINNPNLFTG